MSNAGIGAKGTILIADDEAAVRESLVEVLRDEGYQVEGAPDGATAITALDTQEFDVVISDLRMPGADGLTVLRHARDVAPQTLVLLMTAHATVETTSRRCSAAGLPLEAAHLRTPTRRLSLPPPGSVGSSSCVGRSTADFDNLVGRPAAMRDDALCSAGPDAQCGAHHGRKRECKEWSRARSTTSASPATALCP
jgi:CheY-like chemotaxis protein